MKALKLTLVVAVVVALAPAAASATMWTSKPKGKWSCKSSFNTCVAHTGFRPNKKSWWGQATDSRGNCTNYAAYRLIKNGASDPGFSGSGGAGNWGNVLKKKYVNGSPAVGSLAWWPFGDPDLPAGHVAYVEKIVKGTVYLSDSSFELGSSRWTVRKSQSRWPEAFLHVKDAPRRSNNPRGHLDKAGSPAAGKVRAAGWAFDPNKKTKPVTIHVYVGGKAGKKGAKGYSIGKAGKTRKDVARAFKGVGSKHGFDKVFKTNKRGKQKVCVYAINIGPGSNVLLGCKTVAVRGPKRSEPPAPSSTGDSTGWFDPGPRGWHLRNSLSAGASDYIFARGKNSDIVPVTGDWDGDGRDSTGAFFPWDQTWHLRNSLSHGPSNYIFKRGKNSDVVPVTGDWDGDGRDSTGAYFPWDQTWHLRNSLSSGPSNYIFKRGKPGTTPVVGNWDGK